MAEGLGLKTVRNTAERHWLSNWSVARSYSSLCLKPKSNALNVWCVAP